MPVRTLRPFAALGNAVLGAAVLLLAGCGGGSTTTTSTTGTTRTTSTATAAPQATPRASPHGAAAAATTPVGRTAPAAGTVAAPQILAIALSPRVVGSGSTVSAEVRTTPGVVSVVADVAGQTIPVPRVAAGRFAGSTTIPPLPPFVHGAFAVTFVAHDARGASTQAAASVSVR